MNLSSKREKKTVTKSFRLEPRALAGLDEEAKRRSITINTLASQVLHEFVEFERFIQAHGVVKIPRNLLVALLNAIHEDELVKIGAQLGKNFPLEVISANWGQVNLESVLGFLAEFLPHSNLVNYREKRDVGGSTITLLHGMGPKFSTFLQSYLGEILEMAKIQLKSVRKTEQALIFTF